MNKILLTTIISLMSFNSFALTRTVVGDVDTNFNLASVEQQVSLVQAYSEKNQSDLRVSFVVLDNGGSTDVSPQASLYLTTFNESEEYGAGSVHFLSSINNLISYKRLSAGIYEAVVSVYDYQFEELTCASDETNYQKEVKLTIDARGLTIDVRAMKGLEFFEYKTYTTPVQMTVECN